jgi:hypothetical protein
MVLLQLNSIGGLKSNILSARFSRLCFLEQGKLKQKAFLQFAKQLPVLSSVNIDKLYSKNIVQVKSMGYNTVSN